MLKNIKHYEKEISRTCTHHLIQEAFLFADYNHSKLFVLAKKKRLVSRGFPFIYRDANHYRQTLFTEPKDSQGSRVHERYQNFSLKSRGPIV